MIQRKKNILEKIVKKDYNNELEKILEEKQFGEYEKSTLLNILYKIEAAYNDVETVKQDVETKEEYISNILEIIKNNCNSIKIVNMSDKESKIPENKTYIIDKKNKEIISYPIERKILYAIAKIGKKEKIIKDDYFVIDKTLSELINVGNNINIVEPLRDFNGYSWSNIPQEIESVDHNLIYQNLRIIMGYKFLNKWINNNEYIIDYFDKFKEELKEKYGNEQSNKFLDTLLKISILLSAKFDKAERENLIKIKEEIKKEFLKIQDKETFIESITNKKIEITNKIKEIDTIINNEKLLQEEYIKRNEKLSLENKIFSMRILAQMMSEERDKNFIEIEELNNLINPQNFVKYKKEIEDKYNFLKILDSEDIEKELNKYKIKFQKIFLDLLKSNINKSETKQEIIKIIYDFRYYLLLPYDYEKSIKDIESLEKQIDEIGRFLLEKAIELKAIQEISEDKENNYEILKNIFKNNKTRRCIFKNN